MINYTGLYLKHTVCLVERVTIPKIRTPTLRMLFRDAWQYVRTEGGFHAMWCLGFPRGIFVTKTRGFNSNSGATAVNDALEPGTGNWHCPAPADSWGCRPQHVVIQFRYSSGAIHDSRRVWTFRRTATDRKPDGWVLQ